MITFGFWKSSHRYYQLLLNKNANYDTKLGSLENNSVRLFQIHINLLLKK